MTEYVDKFPVYGNVPPVQSLKPKQEYQNHGGKMESITTFKSDYLPYDVSGRPIQLQEEYKPASGTMDLGTTYRRDYNAHKVQPVILVKPVERNYVRKGKLDTVPTYQADYRVWEIQRREPYKADNTYHPPVEKFGNTTTFQDAFVPREITLQKSFKPTIAAKLSDQPFTSITSHRSDYVPHQLEPKQKQPVKEYRPNSQSFQDMTTHRSDFRGLLGELPKSFKPKQSRVELKAHFDGSTEFRDRFQPWAISLPEVHKAKEYIPPTEHMDLNTTNQLAYIPYDVHPVVLRKPLERSKRTNAPFEGSTTMKDAFQAWDTCQTEIVKKNQEMPKLSGKFDGMTTFRAHYVPYSVTPQKSCKPQRKAVTSSAPFEDQTMYRTDYVPKKPEICPANYASPPGYVYMNTDSRGHKFFRKVTPDVLKLDQSNSNHVPQEIAVVS